MATSKLQDFRKKTVSVIVADIKYDVPERLGQFVDASDYDALVTSDTDCYTKPTCDIATVNDCGDEADFSKCPQGVNEENVAFIFRKNWFTEEQQLGAYHGLRDAARESDNRGNAAGPLVEIPSGNRERVTKMQYEVLEYMMNPKARLDDGDNIDDIRSKYKVPEFTKELWVLVEMDAGFQFESWLKEARKLSREEQVVEASRVYEWISISGYANKVRSGIAGFYDRYPRIPFLRSTGYNEQNPEKFKKSLPFLQRLDHGFKKLLPKRYAAQQKAADKIDSRYLIEGTVFTTLTVNSKFRTAAHYDAGDLNAGFSNLVVVSNDGDYTGGYLVFPEYRVAVDVRPGDLLLVANHTIMHGNTEFIFGSPTSDRVSFVAYFREGMLNGGVKEYEDARKEYVHSRRLNTNHKLQTGRWNGISMGMWNDNEWKDFMMTKPDGEKWIKDYHQEMIKEDLSEFFG